MRIPYKWRLVIILWIAFFFNQADRQIFNVVLPEIRDDLGFSDAQMGLIATSFLLVYGLLVPVAGIVGDIFSKKKVIVVSLLVWTTATLLTGFSVTIWHFILLRCIAMGGGEAFYSPSANSLISESHKKTLSTALSVHQTALYIGVVLSSFITGYIAELYGWRTPFFVFGAAGLLLAIMIHYQVKEAGVSIKKEKVDGNVQDSFTPANGHEIKQKERVRHVLGVFFKKPTAILLALAFAGMQFVGMGFMTWMPTFLNEKYGLSLSQAGFDSTFYYKIAALIAIVFGGRITDALSKRISGARGLIQAIGLLIGVPAIYFMGMTSTLTVVYIAMIGYGICQGLYDSNIFASLYEVIDVPYRATATGIMLSFAFVVGATAPLVLGLIKPLIGLAEGISLLSIGLFLSATFIVIARKFFLKNDQLNA